MLVGKWPNLLAIHGEGTEQKLIFAQRDCEQGTAAADVDNCSGGLVTAAIKVGLSDIINVDKWCTADDPQPGHAVGRSQWPGRMLSEKRCFAMRRNETEQFAVIGRKLTVSGLAQPGSPFEHRVEHRG